MRAKHSVVVNRRSPSAVDAQLDSSRFNAGSGLPASPFDEFRPCGNLILKLAHGNADQVDMWEHTLKHRVNHLEGLVDLLSDLGSSEDDLATDEDQKDDFWLVIWLDSEDKSAYGN